MLDPRIYRTALLPVVLAVIVFAFSLSDQQAALTSNLPPVAFSGSNAYASMTALAREYPKRPPGSAADDAIASYVASRLGGPNGYGFEISRSFFRARTANGTRTLENVIGIRAGQQNGSIVVVAHRDSLGSPATAELSGTAVLLELARDFSGETLQHTIVLASTSGSVGAAGAAQLARELPQPVDAVIVLGDLAGVSVREPVLLPWSNGQRVAPTLLRNTIGATLSSDASLSPGSTGLLGQLAHLAFPMTPSEQAPFNSSGEPAVLVSVAGERGPAVNEPTSLDRISGIGEAVLQSVSALDAGPTVSPPSTYLLLGGKVVPAWAVRLLVLTLILPVLLTSIDGLARARRRGYPILRWVVWVLSAALPFALAAVLVVLVRAIGLTAAAPPGPVARGVALRAGDIALLAVLGCTIVGGLVLLRPFVIRLLGPRAGERDSRNPGAAAAVLIVLSVISLAIWWANPFAAALLVLALHLWMWVVVPDVRLPMPGLVLLLAIGLAAPALIPVYYALTLGLGPVGFAWSSTLLLAGGAVGLFSVLEWSVVIGCALSVVAIAVRSARERKPEDVPVTIRGPVTYAGPGSLGGTESALRR
jgi:hypothetical protein